jgi:hypothetical protein
VSFRRVRLSWLLLLWLGGGGISGCSRTGEVSSHTNVLRIAVQSDVKTLNPFLATSSTELMIGRLMFEPLLSGEKA